MAGHAAGFDVETQVGVDESLKRLAAKLTKRFGKGFNLIGLKRMRQFYRAFPQGSSLPEDNEQSVAARYQMYLPTEDELRAELARERDEAERVLRLAGAECLRHDAVRRLPRATAKSAARGGRTSSDGRVASAPP